MSFAIAFVAVVLIKTYVFAPYIVEGASMDPTLHDGERLMVNKAVYLVDQPERGDIVIIKDSTEDRHYVKRVVALPGDKVEVKNDELYVNEQLIKEPYLSDNRNQARKLGMMLTGNIDPIIIPEGEIYVMGDNRLVSKDSRNGLGLIKDDDIVGKTEIVFYPIPRLRTVE
ncbi:signal peptidase I [Bacillus marinisedimentorum]|uniref:signal peptidase I n=1 Tax=Bacillus marinisedimentorum TaxID=1821260 RepID=UPI0007E00A79